MAAAAIKEHSAPARSSLLPHTPGILSLCPPGPPVSPSLSSLGLPHLTHSPQMHPLPKSPSRDSFPMKCSPPMKRLLLRVIWALLTVPIPGSRVLSMAASNLGAPPSPHLPRLISEAHVVSSMSVPSLSRANRNAHTSLCHSAGFCATSQDAEMSMRTWAPSCSERGSRGVEGKAGGCKNQPATCLVMSGPQPCL